MKNIVSREGLKDKIFTVREKQVMLDSDFANLYQVNVKRLNEQVKRNSGRFPERFRFQLAYEEFQNLKSQFATSSQGHGGKRKLPYVFTEQGVSMLSAVLRSDVAVGVSVKIIDAFVEMRRFISTNAVIFQRIDGIEKRHSKMESDVSTILNALEDKSIKPKQGIFYDGQIFDAHVFVSKLIRSAKKSIVLIDNFVDESVLQLLHKRKKGVKVVLYTKAISKTLKQDLGKYNAQYGDSITVKIFTKAHDRFLIIDDGVVYHFGASLKDIGKKWFAFSRFDKKGLEILQKLK